MRPQNASRLAHTQNWAWSVLAARTPARPWQFANPRRTVKNWHTTMTGTMFLGNE